MCDRRCFALRARKCGYILIYLTIVWHTSVHAEGLIDPTRPPSHSMPGKSTGIKSAPRWLLTSTLIAPARRLATINGATVSVGERVNGARVLTIEPARVLLRAGKKDVVVELSPRDFKRLR